MLMLALCLFLWQQGNDGFVVIAHRDFPAQSLTKRQLRHIFLKQISTIGKHPIYPIQYRSEESLQALFEAAILGKRFDAKAYWYEQQVQAGEKPPLLVQNEAHALIYIARNPGYIGFVPKGLSLEASKLGAKIIRVSDP